MEKRIVILGAGPAGLTAAYDLIKAGSRPTVLEKLDTVGGLARTDNYRGFHFDMGGHRFFTKVEPVERMWREVLGDDFLRRPRMSRIYYNGKFFQYPLKPFNALGGLGILQSILVVLSYVRWQLFPHRNEETFEQWVTNRFGKRLFETFFKTYTEKVWGVSCSELKAEWAAQRIKDLSLKTAVFNMFVASRKTIKTLIEEFDYPRLGPGMMWRAVADRVREAGGMVQMRHDVVSLRRNGRCIEAVVASCDGEERAFPCDSVISSMPISELVAKLDPPAPPEVAQAARKLTYRDFLTVCLIVDRPNLFPDNWIYIHDPGVEVGRIQNYKNWSPEMVPDPTKSSLGLEYFCTEGDELWCRPDDELIEQAKREIDATGLARAVDVVDGCVVRVPKAYPVYDADYQEYLATVRTFVDELENVQTIGRNGLHRYNNQDHAMLTGMLAVRNLLYGERHDMWSVNADAEYHEEVRGQTQAEHEGATLLGEALAEAFAKLDRVAFGTALGALCALVLAIVSVFLQVKGGESVGVPLNLVAQYLPGYGATPSGALLGAGYGAVIGYGLGWSFALLRNTGALAYATIIERRIEGPFLRKLLDYI